MVTMLDVAKKAGVSKATVSRVLNGKNIVSDAVKKQVFHAIKETGYRPNLLARQMATQKTNLIGLVMTNGLYNGPYFSSLVYAAASFSEKYQHQLILADGKHSANDERQAIDYLLDIRCAGILIYPEYLSAQELSKIITASSTPIIVINRELAECRQQCVFMDHYHSTELMMDYVIAQGHRQIAFIKGREHSSSGQQRYQAYCDKLVANQIQLEPKRVVSGDWSLQSGYDAVQELLSRDVTFSMIVAGNDDMASGAMKALREANLRVPEDVSISGIDNSPFSQYIYPALTTINVPIQQMVEQGILQLIAPTDTKANQLIEGELIIRDSVLNIV
ncbi:LacI family DNA-binding transcriptional regulator [Celerinatantimonas diazotrophica]|uniref:LacI family transcriptional regulator n=1 Tax=Celerinatantimonas diazotrophica TaxID=412034 RepID=A0A4R1JLF7_9GAMM|nr:LacI family DNA-binding transcriptional regulator [Celerinatantimonas diazotrophica]TCK51866.1 LacI family transcriptional regulator [Celerinatantimonas diazotrophica]CAG9296441.1 HTH-type transcriptional regulator AscG [Celerinatantimonas diazotrophica]